MEFNNYYEARAFFQQQRIHLDVEDLPVIITAVEKLRSPRLFPKELEDIEDLIIDIEVLAMEREQEANYKELEEKRKIELRKEKERVEKAEEDFNLSGNLRIDVLNFGTDNLLAQAEKMLIRKTLFHCRGNRTHTAAVLGICVRTLRNKLYQYRHEGWTNVQ